MMTKFLFPHSCKRVGWWILIPAAILGILLVFELINFGLLDNTKAFAVYSDEFLGKTVFFDMVENNISDEIIGILFIIGALLVAFSKEKEEDEFIAKIRMESLVWATHINYGILIFCMLFFYGTGFYFVMLFNMFTILILFILRYYFQLYQSKKSMRYEE